MKKTICIMLLCLLLCLLALPVAAATEMPYITLEPQSPNYPEYSVAIYTVKANGTNLSAYWYMEWQGKTYAISGIGGDMQDWEAYAGESYGARKLDDNTFAFIFEGIEYELDGAYIWCVVEDGHYDVTSQKARISVGNENSPPTILDIPAQLTVEQGELAEIRCVAQAPADKQLSYIWYESSSGRLQDIQAIGRGNETGDFLFCDTASTGTRYYVCLVQTSSGGMAYSSVVPVTVTEKKSVALPPQVTETPTEAPSPENTGGPAAPVTEAPQKLPEITVSQETKAPELDGGVDNADDALQWWVYVLAAVVAAAAGVGVAVILIRKK